MINNVHKVCLSLQSLIFEPENFGENYTQVRLKIINLFLVNKKGFKRLNSILTSDNTYRNLVSINQVRRKLILYIY